MADPSTFNLTVVVMAKPAVPGQVKTRLIGTLTARQAAAVHDAMLACAMERLAEILPGDHVLALAGRYDVCQPPSPSPWRVVDQGQGDLGQRLDRVWRSVGAGPIVFFGADSPDVPAKALRAIPAALASADGAIGPADDGGYWTLAARRYLPRLIQGIDWGGPNVYHQTLAAAADAGVALAPLPRWRDIDHPHDLIALRRRLDAISTRHKPMESALLRLRQRLRQVCEEPP